MAAGKLRADKTGYVGMFSQEQGEEKEPMSFVYMCSVDSPLIYSMSFPYLLLIDLCFSVLAVRKVRKLRKVHTYAA